MITLHALVNYYGKSLKILNRLRLISFIKFHPITQVNIFVL